jgi:hypothetical protein
MAHSAKLLLPLAAVRVTVRFCKTTYLDGSFLCSVVGVNIYAYVVWRFHARSVGAVKQGL